MTRKRNRKGGWLNSALAAFMFGLCLFDGGQISDAASTPVRIHHDPGDQTQSESPTTDVPATPDSDSTSDRVIDNLISQLDSDSYQAREQASTKLATLGERAVGPLALKSLGCSPEMCWRIRKTLEEICVTGDESVLYKAAGILQVRFHSQDTEISDRLLVLEARWRQQRHKNAIQKMRQLGATVDSPTGGIDTLAAQRFAGNQLMLNGMVFNSLDRDPFSTQTSAAPPPTRKQVSKQEQAARISKILESDIEENRRFLFGSNEAPQPQRSPLSQQRIFINQGFAVPRPGLNGVSVQFEDAWKGTTTDLKTLAEIERLGHIIFTDQTVSLETLEVIADLKALQKITLDKSRFSSGDLVKLESLKVLEEIAFVDQEITTDLIENCAGIGSLKSMSFDRCDIEGEALKALGSIASLVGLEFKETVIQTSTFEALAKLESLRFINLTACKFQTVDYRELQLRRPKLQITFTAQALLGIRSVPRNGLIIPPDRIESSPGCEVTEVINPSGAHTAGMIVGDVIEKIDGQAVKTFDDLRLKIAQHFAGDELDILIRRDGKTLNLNVKLGKMDTSIDQ